MKTKFTKGEWFVSGGDQIVSMPSQCKIANRVSGWNQEEAEANAKLIASAPDLLDALNVLTKWVSALTDWEGGTTIDPDLNKAIQAIKKATE